MQKQNQKQKQQRPARRIQVAAVKRKPTRAGTQQSKSFAAAAYSSGQRVRQPNIKADGRSTRIVHRELVANISGSTAFSVQSSFDLNPGLTASFPWLSTQASGWEQFRFNRLDYEFVTRAPTTSTGGVFLAPDYDVLDAAPSSEQAISTYKDTVEDAPWKDQVCKLDPKAMFPLGPRKYIRDGLVANSDLKTYDAGRLHIATGGQADTSSVGKLWVSYDVEFFVPQTEAAVAPTPRDLSQFQLEADQSLVTGVDEDIAFDTVIINGLGIVNNSGQFVLPKGNYLVTAESEISGGTSAVQSGSWVIRKNGSDVAPACSSSRNLSNAGAGTNSMGVALSRYIFSDGTDYVTARVNYISGAGTLVVKAHSNRITFQAI